MIQRTSNTIEQIALELARLQRRIQILETQEIPTPITAHSGLTGIGTNTHAQIDTHMTGTNTHAQIDTHLAAVIAHGATGAVVGTTNTQTLSNKTLAKLTLSRSDKTISGDAVAVTGAYHRVDTEGAAGTDNLSTLSGMVTGQIIILSNVATARQVTVKHAVGNIFLANNTDFLLGNSRDHIVLICTGGEINELSRSKNS